MVSASRRAAELGRDLDLVPLPPGRLPGVEAPRPGAFPAAIAAELDTLRPSARRVYRELARLAESSPHGLCWPSRKHLANAADVAEKTVTAALVTLQVRRLIARRCIPTDRHPFYVVVVAGWFHELGLVPQSAAMALLLAGDDDLGAERIRQAVAWGALGEVPRVRIGRYRERPLALLGRPHHREGGPALRAARREFAWAAAALLFTATASHRCHVLRHLEHRVRPVPLGSPRRAVPSDPAIVAPREVGGRAAPTNPPAAGPSRWRGSLPRCFKIDDELVLRDAALAVELVRGFPAALRAESDSASRASRSGALERVPLRSAGSRSLARGGAPPEVPDAGDGLREVG